MEDPVPETEGQVQEEENSSGASSDTGTGSSSKGKTDDFEEKMEKNQGKRFDYLLKQTEIFSHFMMSSNRDKSPTSPLKIKPSKEKGKKVEERRPSESTDHRHRKTEQEEDEE